MPDPVAEGTHRAEGLLALPGMRDVLFEIRPLAGKMAAAASLLTEADFADLAAFKDMTPAALGAALSFGPAFARAGNTGLPLAARRREELLNLLSGYGLFAAVALIRDEVAKTLPELARELEERSGLSALRGLLLNHFADRADIIKTRRLIDDAEKLPRTLPPGTSPHAVNDAWLAVAQLTSLAREPVFRQLAVLRDYWQGHLTLSPVEGEELLRVAGERGTGLAARLGAAAGTPSRELAGIAAARHDYWLRAAEDHRYRGATRTACRVILRAYDDITDDITHDFTGEITGEITGRRDADG
jgi:hypothetical protein